MSLKYLKEAVTDNDTEKLIRYVRLHLGDGNEEVGRKEIDKAWIEALKLLLDVPPDRPRVYSANLSRKGSRDARTSIFSSSFLLCRAFGRMDTRW